MHNRIRIARGNSSTQAFKDTVPEKGQPVYDTKDNKLYIGDGNNKLEDLSDITVSKAQDSIHADNVTKTINNNNITDIFEPGSTLGSTTVVVKNTTNSDKIKDWGASNTSYVKIAIVNSLPLPPESDVIYLVVD